MRSSTFPASTPLFEELGPTQARGLPKFPAVARDIAMLVRDQFSAGEIADALREASDGLAESVRLFDLYRGDQIPDGHRSLAFRVTYRDPEGTLTDKRVEKVHASLARLASDRFEATIPLGIPPICENTHLSIHDLAPNP